MSSTFIQLPPSSGGSGAVNSVFGRTGNVGAAGGDYSAFQITYDPMGSVSATDVQSAINELDTEKLPATIGPANAFLGTDNSGVIGQLPGWNVSTASGGLNYIRDQQPNDGGGNSVHTDVTNFDPLQNSPNEVWTIKNTFANLDVSSSGFGQGTNGGAVTLHNNSFNHQGTGDVGSLTFSNNAFGIGNGTDPISVKGISYSMGFGGINDNVTLNGPLQGYGFQPYVTSSAFIDTSNSYVSAFFDGANIGVTPGPYTSFNSGPFVENIGNNKNFASFVCNPNINSFSGNAGFTGVAVGGNLGTFDTGGFTGININTNIASANSAVGIDVYMGGVTPYAGTVSQVTIQDLTLQFLLPGDHNNLTVEFVNDGTAGSETASVIGNAITVHMQSGVSTASQVKTALDSNITILSNVTTTVSGVGSNPQVTQAPTSFSGGSNPGNVLAARFTGDVQINGSLSFSGALSIGKLSSFAEQMVVDGGGNPASIHSLISSPLVPDGTTVANADTIGVNTASLIGVGVGCTVTSGPFGLGLSALALPAVVTVGTGSVVDIINGGTFALSMSGGGGTVNKATGSRSVFIGDGTTTVDRFIAYYAQVLGPSATENWGIHAAQPEYNFLQSLKIGGSEGSTDKVDSGIKLQTDGAARFDGNIGFFATAPVSQQSSSGAQTASIVYGATEQTMIQEMYDALRSYGLLS
jgi:hypothetical protein